MKAAEDPRGEWSEQEPHHIDSHVSPTRLNGTSSLVSRVAGSIPGSATIIILSLDFSAYGMYPHWSNALCLLKGHHHDIISWTLR